MKYPAKNNSTKLMKTVNILSETLWSMRLPIYDAITLINPIAVPRYTMSIVMYWLIARTPSFGRFSKAVANANVPIRECLVNP